MVAVLEYKQGTVRFWYEVAIKLKKNIWEKRIVYDKEDGKSWLNNSQLEEQVINMNIINININERQDRSSLKRTFFSMLLVDKT